jgi:hypothetical protein
MEAGDLDAVHHERGWRVPRRGEGYFSHYVKRNPLSAARWKQPTRAALSHGDTTFDQVSLSPVAGIFAAFFPVFDY